jgi:hypothetical protein
MAIIVNGVTATVYLGEDGGSGGIEESWPEGQPAKVVVYYKVPWASRYAFIAGLRGGVSAGTVLLPHAYPHSPNLTCVGIGSIRNLKPKISSTGLVDYQWAIVPAEYGVPQFDMMGSGGGGGGGGAGADYTDPSGKPFTNTDWQVTVETFQPPTGAYYWQSGPSAGKAIPDSTLGLIRSRVEFTIRRSWLAYPPLAFFMAYSGSVNSVPVRISDYVFRRGSLYLPGGQGGMSRDGSLEGRTGELVYTLVGNGPVSVNGEPYVPEWNEYMAIDGSWQYANTEIDGSGDWPYRYSNFWAYLP